MAKVKSRKADLKVTHEKHLERRRRQRHCVTPHKAMMLLHGFSIATEQLVGLDHFGRLTAFSARTSGCIGHQWMQWDGVHRCLYRLFAAL